jgi:hypothetical protein
MSTHRGATNETHRIQIASTLERVAWDRRLAAPGARVGLDVRTHFVGNGAQVQVQLRDGAGTTFSTFTEGITAGRLRAAVSVPPEARDTLFADVKLPKHGLQTTSPPLPLTPPITVRDPKWQKDGSAATEARRGDTLTLTATVEGAPDGLEAELVIFEHDSDGAHDLITRFPTRIRTEKIEPEWDFEYHEDTDDVPTAGETETGYQHPEYFFRVDVGGLTAQSDTLKFQDWVAFEVRDAFGNVPEDVTGLVILAPDGTELEKSLDADGRVRLEDTLPGVYEVKEYLYADS